MSLVRVMERIIRLLHVLRRVYADADEQAGRDVLSYAVRFPAILLIVFGIIAAYFRSKGGYKPIELDAG